MVVRPQAMRAGDNNKLAEKRVGPTGPVVFKPNIVKPRRRRGILDDECGHVDDLTVESEEEEEEEDGYLKDMIDDEYDDEQPLRM